MTPAKKISWAEANQSYLLMEFLGLRRRLGETGENSPDQPIKEIREILTPPPAIDQLTKIFALSSFERRILLLCAGIELDPVYVDVAVARWERFSGRTAERVDD